MYSFKHIEKVTKVKYPQFIKKILADCGYDSAVSLQTIDEKAIDKIEVEINSNLIIYRDYFENTLYEKKLDNSEFKFLIGHRAILLDLPNKIKQCNEEKERLKSSSKLNKTNSLANSTITAENLTEKQLIEKLSEKIINFLKNKGISAASIHYFSTDALLEKLEKKEHTLTKKQEENGTTVKCKLKCPFCVKKLYCNRYKYWNISNFTKHLNTHDEKLKEIDKILEANIVQSNNNSSSLANSDSAVTSRLASRGQSTIAPSSQSRTQIYRFNPSALAIVRNILNQSKKKPGNIFT